MDSSHLREILVEFPDEVTQAVLSELSIHTVVAEDLLFFSNLSRLDMSDNEVSRTNESFDQSIADDRLRPGYI